MTNRCYSVYCLRDPNTGEIRYFGQTCRMKIRFYQHLEAKEDFYVCRWIRGLRKENKKPICEVLATALTKEDANEIEIALIALGRQENYRLTNLTDGGDGTVGFTPSADTLKKMSEANLGKRLTKEHRQKISAALTGKKHSKEHIQKVRETNTGKKRTKKVRQKMSAAHTGKRLTETHKKNISASLAGREFTEGHRRKISVSQTRRWRRERKGRK